MIQVFIGFGLLASAITANKFLLFSLPPLLLVGLRMLIAGIILFAITHRHALVQRIPYLRHDFRALVLIALLTTFIPSWCKAYALQQLPSWKAAFIGTLDPFVTALYAYLLWQERLTVKKTLGILLGFLGAVIICFKPDTAVHWWQFVSLSWPELAAFTAVATSRYGWIMAQRLLKQHRYTPAELNAFTMTGSGLVALPLSFIAEASLPALIGLAPTGYGYLAYTIIIGNVIAYTMYGYFLKAYSATFVSLAGFSVPFFVTFYGWLFLGERVTSWFIVAAFITLLGVYLFYADELKHTT